jgi:hypothetical protein
VHLRGRVPDRITSTHTPLGYRDVGHRFCAQVSRGLPASAAQTCTSPESLHLSSFPPYLERLLHHLVVIKAAKPPPSLIPRFLCLGHLSPGPTTPYHSSSHSGSATWLHFPSPKCISWPSTLKTSPGPQTVIQKRIHRHCQTSFSELLRSTFPRPALENARIRDGAPCR